MTTGTTVMANAMFTLAEFMFLWKFTTQCNPDTDKRMPHDLPPLWSHQWSINWTHDPQFLQKNPSVREVITQLEVCPSEVKPRNHYNTL